MKIRINLRPSLSLLVAIGSFLIPLLAINLFGAEPSAGKGTGKQPAPRVERWEQTIKDFEALDAKTPPPKGAILIVGGSNAKRWRDAADYLPGHQIINRGFGGGRLSEVVHFADRIILPYAPKAILINAGGNDLKAGSSPVHIRDNAQTLIATVHDKFPDTRIYFIGLPYMERVQGNPEAQAVIRDFNEQLSTLAQKYPKVGFIDIAPAFLNERGEFQSDLFVEDGTHYSSKGYMVIAELIREKL